MQNQKEDYQLTDNEKAFLYYCMFFVTISSIALPIGLIVYAIVK